jgi:hypothetical protein
MGSRSAVSHPQAFHTSCRSGLAGISGFQINAATPGLDREQLAAMSEAHARYETPHDMPYEPTPEQMREFPVALKMSVVPTVGPVVSRTEYVGREYRGRDGGPDEGRFGNYFCHMVVGAPGVDPFDGLAAVELWDAPHWTTGEAADPALPELGSLTPGPLDIQSVLDVVTAAPAGVGAALLEGALRAIDGGPPLLIVDPMADRAATWLAWITFALPPHVARSLTFSTFEGRPQDVLDLHVVVTTPVCDGGPTTSSRFARVEVATPASSGTPGLYTRVAVALAAQGPDVLAAAVSKVRTTTAAEQGASLAIIGKSTELVTDEELPVVLGHVLGLLGAGRAGEAEEAVAGLAPSEAGDRLAIRAWAELYLQARRSTAGDPARELASVALARLVSHLDDLPEDLPGIPADAPAAPGVGGIGAWLRATEAAQGSDQSGRLVQHGVALGLIGLNVPVDTRVAAVIAHDLDQPAMVAALDVLDADGMNDHVIRQVTEAVAAEPRTERSRRRLLTLSRYEMAQQTIRRRAEELGTFDANAAWQQVRVAMDPRLRSEAATVLAEVAADAGAEAEIRELWGPAGPQTERELDELLRAYIVAGRQVPSVDREDAFQLLMASSLPKRKPPAGSIGFTLAKLPDGASERPDFFAWRSAFDRPGLTVASLDGWSRRAAAAFVADAAQVPDARWLELLDRVAETLIDERNDPGFAAALLKFDSSHFERLCACMGQTLAREVDAANDRPLVAQREFRFWSGLPIRDLPDLVLPEAFRPLSQKEIDEVGKFFLTSRLGPAWETWTERHPRTGARVALARVFRRGGKDRDGGEG